MRWLVSSLCSLQYNFEFEPIMNKSQNFLPLTHPFIRSVHEWMKERFVCNNYDISTFVWTLLSDKSPDLSLIRPSSGTLKWPHTLTKTSTWFDVGVSVNLWSNVYSKFRCKFVETLTDWAFKIWNVLHYSCNYRATKGKTRFLKKNEIFWTLQRLYE